MTRRPGSLVVRNLIVPPTLLLALLAPIRSRADGLDRLPSDHWSYAPLEELAELSRSDSISLHVRPMSREDAGKFLLAGRRRFAADPRYLRLCREFGLELERADSAASWRFTSPAVRVREGQSDFRLHFFALAGEAKAAGKPWQPDSLSQLAVSSSFRYGSHWFLHSSFVIRKYAGSRNYADPLLGGTDITGLTRQAYVTMANGAFDVTLGRDRPSWDPGETGGLLLSDAGPSMSLLDFGVHWKSLHARAITALLNSSQGEYLSAHRVEFTLSPRWTLVASEAARYRSNQPEPLYLLGLIPYTAVQRLVAADAFPDSGFEAARNNLMVMFAGIWRPLPGWRWKAELLLDDLGRLRDSADGTRNKIGYRFAGMWTQAGSARPLTARAEWTRVDNYVYSVDYGENFTHQGGPLGYPLGPDVRSILASIDWDPAAEVRVGIAASRIDKGEGTLGRFLRTSPPDPGQPAPSRFLGVLETRHEIRAQGSWQPRDNVRLRGSLGWSSVKNSGHVRLAPVHSGLGSLVLEVHW